MSNIVGNLKKPNLFIVGGAKSGTTSLYKYLQQHPDIFMTEIKEPNFFNSDLIFMNHNLKLQDYLALFEGWDKEKWGGEASVWYLYSKIAAQRIKAFSPDAAIIIMLRNPIEMVYSHHYEILYNANQDIPSFEEALSLEEQRKRGERLPKTYFIRDILYYREVGKLAQQVQRFLDVFDREQIHFIIYDDFKKDTAKAFSRVLDFLSVDRDFAPNLTVHRSHRAARSQRINRALKNTPQSLKGALSSGLPEPAWKAAKNVMRRFNKLANTQRKQRAPMSRTVRRELQNTFAPEVEQLGRMVDRDLSAWTRL